MYFSMYCNIHYIYINECLSIFPGFVLSLSTLLTKSYVFYSESVNMDILEDKYYILLY